MENARTNLTLISSEIQPDNKQDPTETPESTDAEHVASPEVPDAFQNESQKENIADAAAFLKKRRLINKLNYINFQDTTVLVTLKHSKYNHTLSLKAKPQPCQDENLECRWVDKKNLTRLLTLYEFDSLLVPHGQILLKVRPELTEINAECIKCKLPEHWEEVSSRKVQRYRCRGIKVQILQFSSLFNGALLDFNAVSFRVSLSAMPPQTFQWLNTESRVTAILSTENETIYSGECRIINHTFGQHRRDFVLEPVHNEIQRFRNKKYRNIRQRVQPSPDIIFTHPFTRKLVCLKAIDLSGSGFAVEEETYNAVLLPGMIVPEVELSFANSLRIKCKAQVVYRKLIADARRNPCVKCGFAILDMDAQAHVMLLSILQQADDNKSYISNVVDLDELWDFFFETGFIYPNKYEYLRKNKSQIKETYRKLYTDRPNIARHFIYQDKGLILGHMSMLRYHQNTWLIHHHAARSSVYNKAGLLVLNQIGRFGNASYRLHSMHMDYLMCYYRPDNKFPSRMFGGLVRNVNDPKGCSEDALAYTHLHLLLGDGDKLPIDWELSDTVEEDLQELEKFYEYTSGGLMLSALNLANGTPDQRELDLEFQKMGFRREIHLFTLKKNGRVKVLFMLNLTDIGLNLSDLTNALTTIVLDPEDITADIFKRACNRLTLMLDLKDMPVLIYPVSFMEDFSLPCEKIYNLWVINCQCGDPFFSYLDRLLKYIKH